MGSTCDNYPVGAANDSAAPYNEPLNVDHRRFVSVCISYYDTVELSPNATEEEINQALRNKISDGNFPKEFDIDEVVILND